MTKFTVFHLKNEMLFANFISNVIGVSVVLFLTHGSTSAESLEIAQFFRSISMIFVPCSFMLPLVLTVLYERPIRRYLNIKYQETGILPEPEIKVRQRLLNEPFFLISLDFAIWTTAAVLYSLLSWRAFATQQIAISAFLTSFTTGLITITVAFFVLEHTLQKRLAPYFFPDGGLYATPKTLRIRIRTRLGALFVACNLVPFAAILCTVRRASYANIDPAEVLEQLRLDITIDAILFICVGVWLTFLVSMNLTRPLQEIIRVLRGVRHGHFDRKVRVTSNDEIGYTGDVINEMTGGLKERDQMRHSLDLAMEIQQNLLPKADPKIEGLDIAGTSIYCDETGGDYFDYLYMGENGHRKIGVVVGDVSDHGIPSALLMISVRATLRHHAHHSDNIADMVSDVNRHLSQDVKETGHFMTLFYSMIDRHNKCIRWVNAGHDPAIIYNPIADSFRELTGRALPLGVFYDSEYTESQREITPGQIIVIGTDGIWEAHNQNGMMFGKDKLKEVIHLHANESAKEILDAVINEVEQFIYPLKKEDDLTLVVMKVEQ